MVIGACFLSVCMVVLLVAPTVPPLRRYRDARGKNQLRTTAWWYWLAMGLTAGSLAFVVYATTESAILAYKIMPALIGGILLTTSATAVRAVSLITSFAAGFVGSILLLAAFTEMGNLGLGKMAIVATVVFGLIPTYGAIRHTNHPVRKKVVHPQTP